MTGVEGAVAVELHDVWRRYRVASTRRPRGLRAGLSRDPFRRSPDRWHWALRDVSLRVDAGEAVALIGHNGAGKSTLLRLVGGVGRAERGTVRVQGRIGALIDLGREFHGELTGRQNAEIAAVVGGWSRRDLRHRLPEILEFAELTDFADEPLRAYSDGMRARLAFSVMAHLEPDVLLVDEVLAVGDAPFQRRSIERIDELRRHGAAVLFVSHDLGLVRRVCDRAVWLDRGQVRLAGDSRDVVASYLEDVTGARPDEGGTGSSPGALAAMAVLDEWGMPTSAIRAGDGLEVRVGVCVPDGHEQAQLRVRVLGPDGATAVVDTSTPVHAGDASEHAVCFARLDLAPGEHGVEGALFSADWSARLDEAGPTPLLVRGDGPDTAPLAPPHVWRRGGRT